MVLTDDDLVSRYRREHDANGPTVRFESAGQMVLYLSALPANVAHVAFDPAGRATVVSVAELHKKLGLG
jgi:hypothetical protein